MADDFNVVGKAGDVRPHLFSALAGDIAHLPRAIKIHDRRLKRRMDGLLYIGKEGTSAAEDRRRRMDCQAMAVDVCGDGIQAINIAPDALRSKSINVVHD